MGERGPNTEHLYQRGRIWWCWYYDRDKQQVRCSTGTTDRKAARAKLAEWERIAADPNAQHSQTLNDCLHALLSSMPKETRERTLCFLQAKVKPLVAVLGHERPIATLADPAVGWTYIHARRRMATPRFNVCDRTIRRELRILKRALTMAKSKGRWSGDPQLLIPHDFKPAPTPKGDTISRQDALRAFPLLSPDSAAAAAFALATGAETSALHNALRADLPDDLKTCSEILLRGTKKQHRHAKVPIVTDEQRFLLAYTRKHAAGVDGKLFGNLHRLAHGLRGACLKLGITVVSPHDLRRSAGQWMVDLGVPIELVSKFMRHADSHITETIYASVRPENVRDRMIGDNYFCRSATTIPAGPSRPDGTCMRGSEATSLGPTPELGETRWSETSRSGC